jgi:hypothetical protein
MYRKRSAKSGNEYVAGRLGGTRLLLFYDREQPNEGDEVWSLTVEEIAPGRATATQTVTIATGFRNYCCSA